MAVWFTSIYNEENQMNYKSPLCSCITCHETKSVKGIFSHYLASHTDEATKTKMVGNGNRRNPDNIKQQQELRQKRILYADAPNYCSYCGICLPYEGRNNKFCSHSCAAIVSNSIRNYDTFTPGPKKGTPNKSNKLGPYCPVYFCIVCKKCFAKSSAKSSKKVCDNRECRYKNIQGRVGGYRENSTRVHRTLYKGYWMHSGSELTFAKMLDAASIPWLKNTEQYYEFRYPCGKSGKYYPDFFLPNIGRWIEIKGKRYVREHDNIRQASANAILIMSHELKNIEKILAVCTGSAPVPGD
jgi:hypothetical protein